MSGFPDLIIANSAAGREFRCPWISREPNRSRPKRYRYGSFPAGRRASVSAAPSVELKNEHIAVGVLARLDAMKDHQTFLRAAAIAAKRRPDLRFMCIGEGVERPRLEELARELGIAGQVMLPGGAEPVAALNALDIVCSSSAFGEGFSNSVAEAMSCGRPCIVTDVGNSAMIVENGGSVVPPSDPQALAAAIVDMAGRRKSIDGSKLRSRIVENFSVDAMVERTQHVLATIGFKD